MVRPTLSETENGFKSLNAERPLPILEKHPARSLALTLGLVLKLARWHDAERTRARN